jgi:hypothetical protein
MTCNENEQQQGTKIMLNCRWNGRRRLGSSLKRLLDEAEIGLSRSQWWWMLIMLTMIITICNTWGSCDSGKHSQYTESLRVKFSGIESMWIRDPSRPALGSTQPPIQCVPVFPRVKAAWTWRWLPTACSAEIKERVELKLYSISEPKYYLTVRT